MKISKIAAATARRLFGFCQTDGRMDAGKFRTLTQRLIESKPRDYAAILSALQRLVRLATARRKVTVESAVDLDETGRQRVAASLAAQYGADLVIEYRVQPELLGGLRIRVGDDVLDGSVKGRLDRFTAAIR